jgi:hypothetical protein
VQHLILKNVAQKNDSKHVDQISSSSIIDEQPSMFIITHSTRMAHSRQSIGDQRGVGDRSATDR